MKTRQQDPSCFLRRFVLRLPQHFRCKRKRHPSFCCQRFPMKSTKYTEESSESVVLHDKYSLQAILESFYHKSNLVEPCLPSLPSKLQSFHMSMKSGCSKPLKKVSRSCEQTKLATQLRPESLETPFFIFKSSMRKYIKMSHQNTSKTLLQLLHLANFAARNYQPKIAPARVKSRNLQDQLHESKHQTSTIYRFVLVHLFSINYS